MQCKESFHRVWVIKKQEGKSSKENMPMPMLPFACKCVSPPNAVCSVSYRLHVVHVVPFVILLGTDVDVIESVCIAVAGRRLVEASAAAAISSIIIAARVVVVVVSNGQVSFNSTDLR